MDKKQRLIVYILLAVMIAGAVFLLIIRGRNRIASESRVLVYFVGYNQEKQESYLAPLQRELGKISGLEDKIRFGIEQLFKGLTEEEKTTELTNAVVEDALLLNVRIEGDTVYLDFSKEIEQGGGTAMMTDRLAQIVFTATQFHPVTKVRMLINGKFIKYFSGDGITDVEHPMSRDDFQYTVR